MCLQKRPLIIYSHGAPQSSVGAIAITARDKPLVGESLKMRQLHSTVKVVSSSTTASYAVPIPGTVTTSTPHVSRKVTGTTPVSGPPQLPPMKTLPNIQPLAKQTTVGVKPDTFHVSIPGAISGYRSRFPSTTTTMATTVTTMATTSTSGKASKSRQRIIASNVAPTPIPTVPTCRASVLLKQKTDARDSRLRYTIPRSSKHSQSATTTTSSAAVARKSVDMDAESPKTTVATTATTTTSVASMVLAALAAKAASILLRSGPSTTTMPTLTSSMPNIAYATAIPTVPATVIPITASVAVASTTSDIVRVVPQSDVISTVSTLLPLLQPVTSSGVVAETNVVFSSPVINVGDTADQPVVIDDDSNHSMPDQSCNNDNLNNNEVPSRQASLQDLTGENVNIGDAMVENSSADTSGEKRKPHTSEEERQCVSESHLMSQSDLVAERDLVPDVPEIDVCDDDITRHAAIVNEIEQALRDDPVVNVDNELSSMETLRQDDLMECDIDVDPNQTNNDPIVLDSCFMSSSNKMDDNSLPE